MLDTPQLNRIQRRFLLRIVLVFCVLLGVAPSVRADSASKTTPHEFTFDASKRNPKPHSLHLAGSFNGWSKAATPMRDAGHGIYKVTLPLADGVYYYKFVVDGETWVPDPNSDKELEIDDSYGGRNSAVLIGPDGRKLPPAQPNAIDTEALGHDPAAEADCNVATPHLLRL